MAEPISIQQLKDASLDVKSLEEVVNGDENVVVTTRLGETYPSIKGSIKKVFETGGLPAEPFETKAQMEVDGEALVDGDYALVTDDTVNNGLYVKTVGAWVKSSYDPVLLANQYTDNTAGTALTTTSNLNTLKAGNYYLTTANLNTIVDDSTYTALGYPITTKKGGAVKINVVVAPPSNYSVQTLEFVSQGTRFTRQGSVGGSYQPWASPENLSFGSLLVADNLNNFTKAGQWGIPQSAIDANSPNGLLGYPTGLESGPADFTVSNTASDRTIQIITTRSAVYRRVLKTSSKTVQESWGIVDGGTNTTNTYTTIAEGMAATKRNGDMFWVYPNTGNTLTRLTLYKRLASQTQSIVFEQSSINEYLIAQGAKWEQ